MKAFVVSILAVTVGYSVGFAQRGPEPITAFKPLVANAVPSRPCESLASVTLPNTTIESASVDQGQLIRDHAYLGIHEMTVVGKAMTEAFYGTSPRRAYFNGCSTGGRQGLMEAQRYPADYDGIAAGAPAINWTTLHREQLWGALVMMEAKNYPPMCKLNRATAASVAACDENDGVKDGVIDNPTRCTYDPKALVGTSTTDCGTFTDADADVVRKIWDGPRRTDGSVLWYGLPRGADFGGLSGTQGNPPVARPNPITLDWFRFFLTQNPQWDWMTITRGSYEQLWDQSVEQFSAVIATDNADLRHSATAADVL
jgi:hypothetical protein